MPNALKARLYRANLHYAGDLQLHTASSGAVSMLQSLYLEISDGDIVGVGEVRINIAYLNGYLPQYVEQQAQVFIHSIDWAHKSAINLLADYAIWSSYTISPVASLLDITLHDFLAKQSKVSVAKLLSHGLKKQQNVLSKVSYLTNQTLFLSDIETFRHQAQQYVNRGFLDLKIRVGEDFSQDIQRLTWLREQFNDLTLSIDANGQWSLAEAKNHLRDLYSLNLAYIEQPIARAETKEQREDFLHLAEVARCPIMLDESASTAEDIAWICKVGTPFQAHLKLVKTGGFTPCVDYLNALNAHGIPYMMGQMNEGGIATAATLHIASASGCAHAEIYGADGLIDDPVQGIYYQDGKVGVTSPYGLGVDFLKEQTTLIQTEE